MGVSYHNKIKGFIMGEQHNYMLLSRLQMDCEYYLGCGGRCVKHLYFDTVDEHIENMYKLHGQLEVKPEWLTIEEIGEYKKQMTETE